MSSTPNPESLEMDLIALLVFLGLGVTAFAWLAFADRVLRRALLVYGLGGIVIPFIGIKLVDLLIHTLNLALDRLRA
jgi:K+-transporting ATPase ATPase B chain